jgi:succinyl-CoA synthetase alpha subunit
MASTSDFQFYHQYGRLVIQALEISTLLTRKNQAMEKLKPDVTGVYVAAHQAPAAIEEAIEAEVPLVVVVAEHIPIHDIMRVGNASRN